MEKRLTSEEHFEETVKRSVVAAVLKAAGPTRRQLLAGMGGAALMALIAEVFPLAAWLVSTGPDGRDLSAGGTTSVFLRNPWMGA